jgi:hypothetical protein
MPTPEPSPPFDAQKNSNAANDGKRAPTPFDNPWLLPILLIGLALWFSYDGWLNPNTKSVLFNRVCAPIWALWALWSTRTALRESRLRRETLPRGPTSGPT